MDGQLARLIACAGKDPAAARALVRADPGLLQARTQTGETALHYLVIENDRAGVALLAQLGAVLDAADSSGRTPLGHAVLLGYEELAGWLIEHGAAVDAGSTPPLHHAVAAGRVDLLRALLAAGARPDVQDELGQPVLHAAVQRDHLALVGLLLKAGADPGATGADRTTALHVAAVYASAEICRQLLAAGADRMARDAGGATPAEVAIGWGRQAVAELLRRV
jgi:protein DGCR14